MLSRFGLGESKTTAVIESRAVVCSRVLITHPTTIASTHFRSSDCIRTSVYHCIRLEDERREGDQTTRGDDARFGRKSSSQCGPHSLSLSPNRPPEATHSVARAHSPCHLTFSPLPPPRSALGRAHGRRVGVRVLPTRRAHCSTCRCSDTCVR
jgi:hypothetical protein